MIYDTNGAYTAISVLANSSVTSNVNGAGIDISGFDAAFMAIADIGAATAGTTPSVTFSFQTSDVNTAANFADLSGVTFAAAATNASYQTISVDVHKCKRYLRYKTVLTGTNSPAVPASITLIGYKQYNPT